MTPRFPTILAALALSLTLVACDSSGNGASAPSSSPSVSSDSTASASAPPEQSLEVSAVVTREGEPQVTQSGTTTPIGPGVTLTATAPNALVVGVAKAETTTVQLSGLDGSYAVLEAGEFLLALNKPSGSDPTQQWSWTMHESADSFLFEATPTEQDAANPDADGTVANGAVADGTVVAALIAHTAVESARWVQEAEGPRVFITPSQWARSGSALVQQYGWDTVVRDVPEVLEWPKASLENQFKCHALGALDKETWNLETWYAQATLLELIAARCNPTN